MVRENYSFKKYQKELAKKKKREEKIKSKLDKKNIEAKERLALSDGKCAASAEAPRLIGMPSAPPSAADSEQALNEDVTVV